MRWTATFIPTMKETPSDAEVPSHQLMLRAGLIRQVMAGSYTYLPLGWRAVRKAQEIVRQEMDAAGAVELHMPALQPIDLFERTGRRDAFGNVLINFEIARGDRRIHVALGPTHEEVITDLMAKHISSYRQLPITMYQIQTKFRNEERPRFGVLRTSEFLMKDAYSFGTSLEQLNDAYDAMYAAYCRIFARCGLEYLPVEAESGPIGGDASHEFMIPADNGEDRVVRCTSCTYAANQERAATGRAKFAALPPGEDTETLPVMSMVDTPNVGTIDQVCGFLDCSRNEVIKTLIYVADGQSIAVLVRGDHEANEGKIRRALEAKELRLADPATIEAVTGAAVGFAGPVGIKCRLIADHDVGRLRECVAGANKSDTHLTGVVPRRDFDPGETFDLRNAEADDPCPSCGAPLKIAHGIEVGHVFKLGTKYSESLDATYLDETEARHPIIMGCYGIGINRIIAGLVETRHDASGIVWPLAVAPYAVELIPLNVKDADVGRVADELYLGLQLRGVEVLIDDRNARPGVKFNDADLVGIPLRVVIGGKGLKDGVVEVKWRTDDEAIRLPLENAVQAIAEMLEERRIAELKHAAECAAQYGA